MNAKKKTPLFTTEERLVHLIELAKEAYKRSSDEASFDVHIEDRMRQAVQAWTLEVEIFYEKVESVLDAEEEASNTSETMTEREQGREDANKEIQETNLSHEAAERWCSIVGAPLEGNEYDAGFFAAMKEWSSK